MWVWDLASGRLERTLEGNTGAVVAVAVTSDGQRVVYGGSNVVNASVVEAEQKLVGGFNTEYTRSVIKFTAT